MQNKTHQSVERALDILLAFMSQNEALGTQEISLKLDLHKSTVNRLMHVLTSRGFLHQDITTKKFCLGPAIANLGAELTSFLTQGLTRIAVPFIDALRDQVGETVVLETASSQDTVISYMAEGSGPLRIKGNVGWRQSYNAAAGAKAILAFSDSKMIESILAGKLSRKSPHTMTDIDRLRDDMRKTRKRGFSFEKDENNVGISGFGCPIFNYEEKPVAAVVVAGSTQNVTWARRGEIVPLMKETATAISGALYYEKRRQK